LLKQQQWALLLRIVSGYRTANCPWPWKSRIVQINVVQSKISTGVCAIELYTVQCSAAVNFLVVQVV
jgi:hypothetical protein